MTVVSQPTLVPPTDARGGVVRVAAGAETPTRQGLPTVVGISTATVGAASLAMHLVRVPPGASAMPHRHPGHETAIYILQGRVETRFGPGLRAAVIAEAGDFLYIGADVPHQPVNLSATEPALAVVARTDPRDREHVVAYDPATEEDRAG